MVGTMSGLHREDAGKMSGLHREDAGKMSGLHLEDAGNRYIHSGRTVIIRMQYIWYHANPHKKLGRNIVLEHLVILGDLGAKKNGENHSTGT